jgi:hypothetical protein
MPAGLGEGNQGRPLRNFVKELVHKATCGNSPVKTVTINGDVFDASSGVYRGAINYGECRDAAGNLNADVLMPASIEVGVVGATVALDQMPTVGGNNAPGTFRVQDINGLRKGSVIHVVESGAVVTASDGSITFTGVAVAPGNVTITLTNTATGVVTTSAALPIVAGTANNSASDLADAIIADPAISPLVFAFNVPATAVVNLVALQPGILGNMTVGTLDAGMAGQNTTATPPVNLTIGAPNVGTALVSHVHRSGSITIESWVIDPDFTFPVGSHVIASASGSPMPALVDTKVSSAAGVSAISGQDIAALMDAFMDRTVSGGQNAPITNCVAPTLGVTAFTVGPLPNAPLTTNAFVGNTLTFTSAAPTDPGIQGFSTVIVANNGVNLLTVFPPLPQNPLATDDFVITATQITPMTDQLLSSPGNAGRAIDPVSGLPTGAITEGPNTGAPANNSNVAPVPALAMMAAYKFGECLTGGAGAPAEPNFMLSSELLSDLAGAGLTLDSFPSFPLVADYTAADPSFSIRLPTNVGDRAFPRSGTLRMRADTTTPPAIFPFVGVLGTQPIPSAGAIPFTRGPANAAGESLVTLGVATIAVNVAAGARVFIETGAMNGPKKHGFQGEVKSYDWLSVLRSCVQNFLNYNIPGE